MRASRLAQKRNGFTLVEVLASVAILAIIVPFVMRGASLATAAASQARHQAEAATLGEAKLTDLVAESNWDTQGTQGSFAPAFPQYRWSMQSQQRSDADVTELVMTVTWQEHGQDRTLNVSTMVYAGSTTAGTGGAQ